MQYKILIENDKNVCVNHVTLEILDTPSQLNGAREGYYWAFSRQHNRWGIVRFTIDRWGQDKYFKTGTQGDYSPNFYNQWLGPLPEPEE